MKHIIVAEFNKFLWMENRPQGLFIPSSKRGGYFNCYKHSEDAEQFLKDNDIEYKLTDKLD